MNRDSTPFEPNNRKESDGYTPRHYDWAVAKLSVETWRRFRLGWNDLSPRAIRIWIGILMVGAILVAVFAMILALIGERLDEAGQLAWDETILLWLRDESPIGFKLAMWIEVVGNSIMLVPITLLAAGFAAWLYRPLWSLSFLAEYVILKLQVLAAWKTWDRARPDLIAEGIAAPQSLQAFPSGHVVQTLIIYGMLIFLWMRASRSVPERLLAVLVLVLLVGAAGIGRLRVGAHWPSDVLAGLIIGGSSLFFTLLAVHRAEKEQNKSRKTNIS